MHVLTSPRPAPKTGDELFTHQGTPIGANLRQFWSWACSDLISNAMRGVLAEYIVGLALECVNDCTHMAWDATDLHTRQGWRVEVKSSAYLQSWPQQRPSLISFIIRPSIGWDHMTNVYAVERKRQADVYVFSVFSHPDRATANPLDVDQRDFYVLSTERLNAAVGEQASITLGSLLKHHPTQCSFAELPATSKRQPLTDRNLAPKCPR